MNSVGQFDESELQAYLDGRLEADRAKVASAYLDQYPADAARIADYAAQRDALRAALQFKFDEPVPQREFDDQRRSIIASFALSLEQPATVLNLHVTRWIYSLPVDYWDKVPDRTMAVTQADVQAAAKKYLDPARLQIVAVGDPTRIADLLKKYGTVETYDTNGKRIGQ